MATLDQVLNSKRIVYVGHQGQEIALEYDETAYGDELVIESVKLNKLSDENPRKYRFNNRALERMLTAWDLTESPCPGACQDRKEATNDPICREHMLPVTPETIAKIPTLLRGSMATKILEDARSGAPDDPKLNGSS